MELDKLGKLFTILYKGDNLWLPVYIHRFTLKKERISSQKKQIFSS